jgi:hypothetical protein
VERHFSVGIFLMAFGGITAAISLYIGVTPMLALGLGSLLIGIMTIYLPEPTHTFVERLAGDSGIPALLNIENLLDDLSLNEKGVYIPTTGLGVCPKVFVPLTQGPLIRKPPLNLNNSRRVFITLNESTQAEGILLEAPGRNLLSELETALKIDFSKVEITELHDKLESGLKLLEISKSIVLAMQGDLTVTFQIQLTTFGDLEVKLSRLTPSLLDLLGTPVPSAIAAAVSKSTRQYVTFSRVSINPTDKKITGALQLVR